MINFSPLFHSWSFVAFVVTRGHSWSLVWTKEWARIWSEIYNKYNKYEKRYVESVRTLSQLKKRFKTSSTSLKT